MRLTECTVGQLVVQRPARARIFERYGIDYCCGGKKLLTDACNEKSVDLQILLDDLYQAENEKPEPQLDVAKLSLTELADHIEMTHHTYLKQELPRLDQLTEKVARAHGEHDPRLLEVRRIFLDFRAELESHMMKEEQILFPICRTLEDATAPLQSHCGSVQNPIRVMVTEHEHAGNAMEQFRSLTDDYTPPPDACNTYRALLDALEVLERDMHHHVHKENNVLFPRAVEVEAQRRQ